METLSYCQLMERMLAAEARVVELTAENVGLKDINAWCKTDAFKNMYREFKTAEALGCSDADCMRDAMLVAIMHAPATPATDCIVAGIKADGMEEFAESQKEYVHQHRNKMDQMLCAAYVGSALDAERFAKQLRESAK